MSQSFRRISAIFQRYVLLHRRSLIRAFDICFWPVMDLLIWGFVTMYLQQLAGGSAAQVIVFLIGALISWDIHYRGQQAVTISLMEEIWTRNIVNMLIAPIRLWEWIAASFLYATLKVGLVTLILCVLAKTLYAFEIVRVGWTFVPLAASLLLFGWAIGLLTAGLLLKFGYAAEALIWGIPFLLQPFSCVFYPVESLPHWAQRMARCLPSTYAFEALRASLRGGTVEWSVWGWIVGLNVSYFALGLGCLIWCFQDARAAGRLSRLGQE
ncbi:MAG: ABC transporter permease [Candidatus Omnitrophica bacterium]|nr:ABC transporter permease [Candidatus Omnitrophota bacterium]